MDSLSVISILPPVIAVTMAFITKRLLLSLFTAVIVGGLISASQKESDSLIVDTLANTVSYLFNNMTDIWNLKVLAFVVLILAMISVIIVSGGLKAIVEKLSRYATTPRSAKLITAICGFIVFIDDYANTMIVGSSMRPVTDQYRVSREKLAFIIDATSAPVAGLAVISTWIGFEVGLFGDVSQSLQLNIDGYSMFFDALAFRFYCILMLMFVIVSILTQLDFGPMLVAEKRASATGKLLADDAVPATASAFALVKPADSSRTDIRTAIYPFIALFVVLLGGLWIDGGGLTRLVEHPFALFQWSGWREVIAQTENSSSILLISALAGLVVAIYVSLEISRTDREKIIQAIQTGMKSSLLPIAILLLAWSLKSVCDDLETGKYIVDTLSPYLSPYWFPVLLFFVAALTAFGTGTSWGTMSILIPIAIPLAYQLDMESYGLITMISLGAVLDGAIFGDHCSPISDTTIMSSIASHCDHLHHVKTQIPYSLLVAGVAMMFGYIPAAFDMPAWISYLAGIIVLIVVLKKFGKLSTQTA